MPIENNKLLPASGNTHVFSIAKVSAHTETTSEKIKQFQAYLQAFRKQNLIPSLSVAVVKDGRIIMLESIGFQDHDAEEVTTQDTSYLAASITKTYTGATLLAMDADGHIDLDADFTSFIKLKNVTKNALDMSRQILASVISEVEFLTLVRMLTALVKSPSVDNTFYKWHAVLARPVNTVFWS